MWTGFHTGSDPAQIAAGIYARVRDAEIAKAFHRAIDGVTLGDAAEIDP